MITLLTVQEVEHIAFRLAKELLVFDEPIPDFTTRFPHTLESCLAVPFQKFGSKSLYPTMISKAAILFYLMIKNHPFQNGNKRIAVTTLLLFLNSNGKWFNADIQEFYNFTIWIAQSPASLKKQVLDGIEQFVKDHIINN